MQNQTLFFIVVYPQAFPFFEEVCECARNQTRKDFDIVVVNDGCDEVALEALLENLNAIIIDAVDSIAGNRLLGLEYACKNHYKYLFFCDADDTFTENRYARVLDEFESSHADIVVCNLNVADEKCTPIIKDYFSEEIPNDRWINSEFLKDKNIMGMSNTAIRVDSIPRNLSIPDISIVDWYLFTIFLLQGLRARYIKDSLVNYRQYNANMIGITCFDVITFKKLADYKITHYRMLIENGYVQYQDLYQDSEELKKLSDDEIVEIISNHLAIHPQPLWWQIIKK